MPGMLVFVSGAKSLIAAAPTAHCPSLSRSSTPAIKIDRAQEASKGAVVRA